MTTQQPQPAAGGAAVPDVVEPGLFSTDPPQLLGGRCAACAKVFFPDAVACPFCRSTKVGTQGLATNGTVYSYTVVRVPVPGYAGPLPYGLGLVELPDGIRVTSMLAAPSVEDLAVGVEVHFRLVHVGSEGTPVLSYAYATERES